MEFPGITCGGGFAGTSGESSSFRYGFFDRTVEVIEIVLGNGDIVTASKEQNGDLFRGAASSFGTLGVVTMLGIELVPAKRVVELRYFRVGAMEEGMRILKEEQEDEEVDFMDGMFFSKESGVMCLGKLVDSVPAGEQEKRFLRPKDDWLYINAEKQAARLDQWTEFIPVEDYLFRYDRGAFWMGKYTYRYFAVPFNWFTRWALSKWTHTRVMYHALHQSGLADKYIVQDVAIPYKHAGEFLEYLDGKFQNYPIWVCPFKLSGKDESTAYGGLLGQEQSSAGEDNMMLNFGVWGPGPANYTDFVAWNKAFECKVQALGGRKWLYAHTYYTEEQFWQIYDKVKYDALREKYHAQHLPNLYQKVKVQDKQQGKREDMGWLVWFWSLLWSVWPLAGLYGWVQCLVSEEYLMPKKSAWRVGSKEMKLL